MSKEIEISSSAKGGVAVNPATPSDDNIVTWQFRCRNYQEIMSTVDKMADKTRSGNERKGVVKARNWRLDLDLSDPIQKAKHEYLMKRKNVNGEFWLLTDKSKSDKLSIEGATLQKLMEMSIPQLMNCISADELNEAGLMPSRVDKYQLVAAIMRKKKLA